MNLSTISWESTLTTCQLNSIQTISDKDMEALTNKVGIEILNQTWCAHHRITRIEHQNNIICRFFKKLCDLKYQSKKIQHLFQKLIHHRERKIPAFLSSLSTNPTLQSQVNDLLEHALDSENDRIASEIILHADIKVKKYVDKAMKGNNPKSLELLLRKNSCSHQYYKEILDFYSSQKHAQPEILEIIFKFCTGPIDLNMLMMKAYESSNERIIKWFLSNGASPNRWITNKKNAFHLATDFFSNSHFNATFIHLLIEFQGNINLLDGAGKTAFQYSLAHNANQFETTQLLLDHGADITINSPIINYLKKKDINRIIPFFKDFPLIVEAFLQKTFSLESFIESLKKNCSAYLKSECVNANPLIVALLIEDDELTAKIAAHFSQDEINCYLKNLALIYPGVNLKAFIKLCTQ